MYTFESGQISIHEFGQPIGMTLREEERWGKRRRAFREMPLSGATSSFLRTTRAT